MLAAGAAAFLYVLFAASSKVEAPQSVSGLARFANGGMARLSVLDAPPPMPARPLRDASGAETTLQALTVGKLSVVNFWATWCAPCKMEMPTLAALQRRFAGRIQVIPVSLDEEAKIAQARAELQRLSGGALPFYVDSSRGSVVDVLARGMPATIIYNEAGREVARVIGEADWDSSEAVALIEAALTKQP
jgi:thiol-disulfide isomerase/thioredoxin